MVMEVSATLVATTIFLLPVRAKTRCCSEKDRRPKRGSTVESPFFFAVRIPHVSSMSCCVGIKMRISPGPSLLSSSTALTAASTWDVSPSSSVFGSIGR